MQITSRIVDVPVGEGSSRYLIVHADSHETRALMCPIASHFGGEAYHTAKQHPESCHAIQCAEDIAREVVPGGVSGNWNYFYPDPVWSRTRDEVISALRAQWDLR